MSSVFFLWMSSALGCPGDRERFRQRDHAFLCDGRAERLYECFMSASEQAGCG